MGKSDEQQTKKRAYKTTAGGESKHKHEPSFDTSLGSSPFATTSFDDNDVALRRHSIWSDFFRQLCEYKVQYGHCQVPQKYPANPKLGKWVSTQRTRYKTNTEEKSNSMIADHIRALDGISFDWETNKTDLNWSVRFEQLWEFKAQFGHCQVPQQCAATPELGLWVKHQRSDYRLSQEGKASRMTAERIRALESVDFEWKISRDVWDERFQQLCEFKAQLGHCSVPQGYAANRKLGQWVATQRFHCNLYQEGKASRMTAERFRALDGIGFDWGTNTTDWNVRFEQLCAFKVQHGHCFVPQQYAANPKLGLWVRHQRRHYRSYQEGKPNPMTAERVRAFESVDFEWESRDMWNERFEQLCEFKAQFGHCVVPVKYAAKTKKLGSWVATQRHFCKLYQEGKASRMTAERIRALDGIGFDWGTNTTDWNVRFEQLCAFKVQHGHCFVPQQYAANPKLGLWVRHQRRHYRSYQEGKPNPMTAERVRAFESVDFEWESRDMWNERFEQLCEFKAQFGHCVVPVKYAAKTKKLGSWVATQRHFCKLYQEGKASRMTAERIRALESVGFEWKAPTIKNDLWNQRFQELLEFKAQFGHFRVPVKYAANPKLKQWVSTQRTRYKWNTEGKLSLSEERIRALDGIGFEWKAPRLPNAAKTISTMA